MIKIVCLSDIHGNIPLDVPECDILLIGGDICPTPWSVGRTEKHWVQHDWLKDKFGPWLKKQKVKHTVAVWGNHDWIGQDAPDLVPPLPWTVLTDAGIEVMGLKIWGSPWQQPFFDWAFNLPENKLEPIWAKIPMDTDILLLHGPPHGHCDRAPGIFGGEEWEHTGSPSLTKRIMEIKPQLVICGHIHCARGTSQIGGTLVANVAMVNEKYVMVHAPMVFSIDGRRSA